MDKRFDTPHDALPVVACHEVLIAELTRRVRYIEKQLDTLSSPWWKRLWFRIDGWPSWYVVAEKRKWRPWRRK